MAKSIKWWAKGVFFENCNCKLLCRAHISFKQPCDFERCIGHWAFHFKEAAFGSTPLADLNAFVLGDAPQVMYEGNWLQAIYIDQRSDEAQRKALEKIFTGQAGGVWAVLAQFIGNRMPTQYVPIDFQDEGREKFMKIEGVVETWVKAIKGADKTGLVLGLNMHNQIHGDPQIFALGSTRFEHQGLSLHTDNTHAIYSDFSWKGP